MKTTNIVKAVVIGLMTISAGNIVLAQNLSSEGKPQRVQAIKSPIARELPNGDTLMVYLRGDEHMHWTMTLDGWEIVEKDNGYFYYQTLNRKGEKIASRRKAHNEDKRCACEQRWLTKKGVKK